MRKVSDSLSSETVLCQRVSYKDEATNESSTIDSVRSQRPKITDEQKQRIIACKSL